MGRNGDARYNNQVPRTSVIKALKKHRGIILYAGKELGVPRTTLSQWIKWDKEFSELLTEIKGVPAKYTANELSRPVKEPSIPLSLAKPDSTLDIKPKERQTYVVSCAQNNTDLHKGFVKNLLNLVEENNAQLLIVPIRYKNVTLYANRADYQVSWPVELLSYYLNGNFSVNDNLSILGDLKIQATAVNPLDGIGQVAGNKSAIIGHASLEVKMLANPQDQISRMLITTGSVSQKNYSACKAGYKAEQGHSIGALIVEIEGDKFFIRQIEAEEDGSFYDLDYRYEKGAITRGHRAASLTCGDIHADFVDPAVVAATWTSKNSIVNLCKPRHQFIPDALDFFSANHHHKNNFFLKHAKQKVGRNVVGEEVGRLAKLHNKLWTDPDTTYHYTAANHNDALTRWLNETDPKEDLDNALLYHKLCVFMIENTKVDADGSADIPNPLEFMMKSLIVNPDNTIFHGRNSSTVVAQADHLHGDKGANGTRGSLNHFAKLGLPMIIEHSHTPGRKGKVVQVGTSSKLNLGYNAGYSSWLQCHALEYPNGAVTLLPIIKGQWRPSVI